MIAGVGCCWLASKVSSVAACKQPAQVACRRLSLAESRETGVHARLTVGFAWRCFFRFFYFNLCIAPPGVAQPCASCCFIQHRCCRSRMSNCMQMQLSGGETTDRLGFDYILSSCSKLTDTIDLAGVIYIFAIILCALSGRMPKSHRSRSPLRSLFGLWHASPK